MFKHHLSAVFQNNNKLNNTETKLMSRQPDDLARTIRETQAKTEQNRKMAADAREAADAALQDATEVEQVSGPKMCVSIHDTCHKQPSGCSAAHVSNRLFRR